MAFFPPLWRGLAGTLQGTARGGQGAATVSSRPTGNTQGRTSPTGRREPWAGRAASAPRARIVQPLSAPLGSQGTKAGSHYLLGPRLPAEDSHWRPGQRVRSVLQTQGWWARLHHSRAPSGSSSLTCLRQRPCHPGLPAAGTRGLDAHWLPELTSVSTSSPVIKLGSQAPVSLTLLQRMMIL